MGLDILGESPEPDDKLRVLLRDIVVFYVAQAGSSPLLIIDQCRRNLLINNRFAELSSIIA
jgi:hypothetical protein